MCTLIAIHRRVPGIPLVVAANRDEYLDRPAEAPALRAWGGPPVVAPLDARAGGTWLGLNGEGVFAALTNLRASSPDPTRKSRGWVVKEALGASDAAEAAGRLMRLPEGAYNPFNCFVADAERACLIVYRGSPRLRELDPGVHVIGNLDADEIGAAARPTKLERVLARARAAAEQPRERLLGGLAAICREHGPAGTGESPLDDTCVHAGGTYGTRSSILLELGESPHAGRLLYADGPPCTTAYDDFSSLLRELRQTPGLRTAGTVTRTAS